jgi:DNA invertase Pin-like site-specific DNA recombinase
MGNDYSGIEPQGEEPVSAIAYSYLRFSTADQATGDSRRRQMMMAEKYAADHRLKLDLSLSFKDLGVSAYRGKNAREGALRAFLDAVEHNLVPAGSFLLIESLDRLSRERILAAQSLFMMIIQAGVTIVTLSDQRSYSLASLNQNPLDLIISLVSMMRANEESETKSRRINAAFDKKRAELSVKPWSARCPGWLRLDKATGTFVVVEERADVVRQIYRDALARVGHQTIVTRLNEQQIPLFGHGNQKGKIWQKSLIRHFLRTPTVIGTLIPFKGEYVDGVRRLHPQPPIEDYYPAIIERSTWEAVQNRRKAWAEHYGVGGPKTGRSNLLAGLSRCPYCDRPMMFLGGTNPNWRYYVCRRAYSGAGCSDRWVRYPGIEDALTVDVDGLIESCPRPALSSEARSHTLAHIRSRLHMVRSQLAVIIKEQPIVRQASRPVLAAREAAEAEIGKLLAERKSIRVGRPAWLDLTLGKKLDRLRAVARCQPVDRQELHSILRSLLVKVIIEWEADRMKLVWRHGGESFVQATMKPQREVENPRRAMRPRYEPGVSAPSLPIVAR